MKQTRFTMGVSQRAYEPGQSIRSSTLHFDGDESGSQQSGRKWQKRSGIPFSAQRSIRARIFGVFGVTREFVSYTYFIASS